MAKVKIVAHAGHSGHTDPRRRDKGDVSGVQTSAGDKFHGDVVDLPKEEAKMLVALGRAKHVEDEDDDEPKPKPAK